MNAELLLMFTLDRDRAYLYAHPDYQLVEAEQSRYNHALEQRARGVPAQYITGHQEFWGMDFIVSPAVLIPRPETEHLIEIVLEMIGGRAGTPAPPKAILDLGELVGRPVAPQANTGLGGRASSPVLGMRIVDVGTG